MRQLLQLLLLLQLWILAPLAGCGDRAIEEGRLYDSLVSGVEWETSSFSGVTDSDGKFTFRPNETVTFFLGAVELGSVKGADTITVLDLAGTDSVENETATNIARFLQSLDTDLNADNGIEIPANIRALATTPIQFDISLGAFELDPNVIALITAAQQNNPTPALVSVDQARAHLNETLAELGLNQSPVADAGTDQTVTESDTVTLTGGATDADGFIVDFEWSLISEAEGLTVELIQPTQDEADEDGEEETLEALSVQFVAPEVEVSTVLEFQLTVTDNDGLTGSDTVQVTVEPN